MARGSENFKIYALIAPPIYMEPRYIGITKKTLKRRLHYHFYMAIDKNSSRHVCRWIRKDIAEGCKVETLLIEDNVAYEIWEEREKYHISLYKNLTNSCIGGVGILNRTEETKQKQSIAMKNKWKTKEFREKCLSSFNTLKSANRRSEIMKERNSNPEYQRKAAAGQRKKLQDPDYINYRASINRRPEKIKKQSITAKQKYINDLEFREKRLAQNRNPEIIKKRSETLRKKYQDPIFKELWLEKNRKAIRGKING